MTEQKERGRLYVGWAGMKDARVWCFVTPLDFGVFIYISSLEEEERKCEGAIDYETNFFPPSIEYLALWLTRISYLDDEKHFASLTATNGVSN